MDTRDSKYMCDRGEMWEKYDKKNRNVQEKCMLRGKEYVGEREREREHLIEKDSLGRFEASTVSPPVHRYV